jgi:hypothetical protein
LKQIVHCSLVGNLSGAWKAGIDVLLNRRALRKLFKFAFNDEDYRGENVATLNLDVTHD